MSKRAKPGQATPANQAAPALTAHVIPDTVWVVFARRAYDEPLRQIGTVEADDLDLARVYARSIYDEFAWIEMAVAPRDALITIIAS
ncbi:MAG: hypothetical protein ACRDHE_02630 [Ktedonobacterales bacterium]